MSCWSRRMPLGTRLLAGALKIGFQIDTIPSEANPAGCLCCRRRDGPPCNSLTPEDEGSSGHATKQPCSSAVNNRETIVASTGVWTAKCRARLPPIQKSEASLAEEGDVPSLDAFLAAFEGEEAAGVTGS